MSNDALGILVVYGIFGLVCGIIAAIIAQKRYVKHGGFFWLGFIFGPLGVFATAILVLNKGETIT